MNIYFFHIRHVYDMINFIFNLDQTGQNTCVMLSWASRNGYSQMALAAMSILRTLYRVQPNRFYYTNFLLNIFHTIITRLVIYGVNFPEGKTTGQFECHWASLYNSIK